MEAEAIVVNALIRQPVETVWENWIRPGSIREWNIPFENWHCLVVRNELAEGGYFHFRMQSDDGSEGFDQEGQYRKVIPCQLIQYTFADGRKVSVEFQHIDRNTIIRKSFEAGKGLPEEKQQESGQAILNRFKQYVENK